MSMSLADMQRNLQIPEEAKPYAVLYIEMIDGETSFGMDGKFEGSYLTWKSPANDEDGAEYVSRRVGMNYVKEVRYVPGHWAAYNLANYRLQRDRLESIVESLKNDQLVEERQRKSA